MKNEKETQTTGKSMGLAQSLLPNSLKVTVLKL